jgi:hypothetical protein
MRYAQTPPLNARYRERDVDVSDPADEPVSSDRVHWLRPETTYHSGFKNANDGRSITRRIIRVLGRFSVVVLIGVGATLAWQSYGGEMVRAWAPSLGWLLPGSTTEAPVPAVTSAELQRQLKPMAIDLALVRRSIDQLAANQDQLARKQDQMAQAIAIVQAAEQETSQKMTAPPPPKAVHAPPKPPQPAAQ